MYYVLQREKTILLYRHSAQISLQKKEVHISLSRWRAETPWMNKLWRDCVSESKIFSEISSYPDPTDDQIYWIQTSVSCKDQLTSPVSWSPNINRKKIITFRFKKPLFDNQHSCSKSWDFLPPNFRMGLVSRDHQATSWTPISTPASKLGRRLVTYGIGSKGNIILALRSSVLEPAC